MRALAPSALATLGLLALAPAAAGHPLGNFSVNRLDRVRVSHDRVEVRYVLDQAEVPTFQERGLPRTTILARKRAEVRRGLALRVDGRPVALRVLPGGRLSFPRGQGGLRTTRLELRLEAAVRDARRVELRDGTWPERVGWRAIVPVPGRGTAIRSPVPAEDPTRGLTRYPTGLLDSPPDQRSSVLAVAPGEGTVVAPRLDGGGLATTRAAAADGLPGVFERAAGGDGVLVVLLGAAFAWGAFHALSPGHGKAMVAAYLVGTRGTARQAIALGATVTVTHTAGVFVLGGVALALSRWVLPEELYPWLSLASGLLVLAVGASLVRGRVRWARAARRPHDHDHEHAGHHHAHSHHHGGASGGWRGVLALGASAGLLPCPSALVVLLSALAQREVALGLVLILAFSAGLAATLTALGLAVVRTGRLGARVPAARGLVAALPAVSTVLILLVGAVLTARALPQVV